MSANFKTQIESQSREARRPQDPQDLLLRPVDVDPANTQAWKGVWATDHGTRLRFYVAGLDWFLTTAKITVDQLASFKDDAVVDANQFGWRKTGGATAMAQREMQPFWEKLSKPQFYSARSREPMQFAKASLVILACELALEERLAKQEAGKLDPKFHIDEAVKSGAEVYSHMAIVPACWHLSGFGEEYVERQKALRPTFARDLAQHIRQDDEFLKQLASGHTCSHETVAEILKYCSDIAKASEVPGEIRVSPGRSVLGTLKAASAEKLSLDD